MSIQDRMVRLLSEAKFYSEKFDDEFATEVADALKTKGVNLSKITFDYEEPKYPLSGAPPPKKFRSRLEVSYSLNTYLSFMFFTLDSGIDIERVWISAGQYGFEDYVVQTLLPLLRDVAKKHDVKIKPGVHGDVRPSVEFNHWQGKSFIAVRVQAEPRVRKSDEDGETL